MKRPSCLRGRTRPEMTLGTYWLQQAKLLGSVIVIFRHLLTQLSIWEMNELMVMCTKLVGCYRRPLAAASSSTKTPASWDGRLQTEAGDFGRPSRLPTTGKVYNRICHDAWTLPALQTACFGFETDLSRGRSECLKCLHLYNSEC